MAEVKLPAELANEFDLVKPFRQLIFLPNAKKGIENKKVIVIDRATKEDTPLLLERGYIKRNSSAQNSLADKPSKEKASNSKSS